jgi:hypothetical protein
MNKKFLFLLLSTFLLLSGATRAADYFVKVTATGDGSGTSWDNALSAETFVSKLASDIVADDVIYMAGGVYKSQTGPASYFLTLDKAITIIGGFAPGITGSTVDIVYPSSTPTVFSGDLNSNGIADSDDGYLISVNSSSGDIILKGITVTGGYSATANRPAIHITNGNLKLYYCIIDGNVTTTTANNNAGGAGIYMANASTVYAYRSVISNNSAANRGGGVRMANSSVLTLESCLVTGNNISGLYGGGIQVSGANPKVYCINTTVAYNTANQHGAGINSPGDVYLISSTVADNTTLVEGSEGQDIRCESSERMHFINSIITGREGGEAHIYLNADTRKIVSEGHNIFGSIGGTDGYVFEAQESDETSYYSDIFSNNTLADNDGYPQTVALSNSLPGSTIEELNAFKNTYQITVGDVTKDQRGFARNATGAVSIGAYEYSGETGVKAVQSGQYLIYPTKVSESVTVAGTAGARISVINTSGVQLRSINSAKNLEYISLANYPKGIYFVLVNGTATKIIKE